MNRIPAEDFNFQKYEDTDVINSWQWMISFISDREWQRRKAEIEKKLVVEFRTTVPFSEPLTDGTLLVIKKDVISWYLYLIDALINEPYKYEYFQGARVVPIFKRLGVDLHLIKGIKGINKRMTELLFKRQLEADALLFEILSASLWAKNGYQVSFIPEVNGEKTPDILAIKDKEKWFIECKRQSKTADYTYKETEKRQKMISYISKTLLEKNILLDIVFHVELETLSDTYLKDLLENKLIFATAGKIVSNDEVDIHLEYLDMQSINKFSNEFCVKQHSPVLNNLIGGKPIDNKAFTCGMYGYSYRIGKGEINNLYISDIVKAYGVYWYCDAEESIWAKARGIKSQVIKASKQFKSEDTSFLHIGLETFDGPEVEKIRFEKIMNSLDDFNPNDIKMKWIFCHFFQSYSPPDQDWVFDETVSMLSPFLNIKPPLIQNLMIVPNDGETSHEEFHWNKPLPY